MENLDDQTKRLLQEEQAYTDKPEEMRRLADEIWSGVSGQLDGAAQQGLGGLAQGAVAEVSRNVEGEASPEEVCPEVNCGEFATFKPTYTRRLAPWLVAATLAGLLLAMSLLKVDHPTRPAAVQAPAQKVANLLVRQDLDRVNQTDRSQTVYLVDGTRVILQPGAGIRHAAFLQKDKREVYLEGNAWFDVAKDAHRPFYVYSGDLVVRVLGTSFKVATDKESGDITVLVTTGKVAVTKKTAPLPHPLILTTNQVAFYKGHSRDLVQLTAEKKDFVPEVPTAPTISFNFDETPVIEIFQTLENAYGIPFHYDKATFSHCVVTTSMGDEPLEQKVKVICEAIGATYQLKEDGIFLDGKPCK